VREFFPPSGAKEIDRIVWTNPPAQLDLDTLQVWNVRRPWPIRAWRWRDLAPAAPAADATAPVVWQRGARRRRRRRKRSRSSSPNRSPTRWAIR
jgi:hypothetical protein